MKNSKTTLVIFSLITAVNYAAAQTDPAQLHDKFLKPGAIQTTSKNIYKPSDANIEVITGCFLATNIYMKVMLPTIPESTISSMDLTNSRDAQNLLDDIISIVNKQVDSFGNRDNYFSKTKPYNANFRSYFLVPGDNNQLKPNTKNIVTYLNSCKALRNIALGK